jgi:hypothetical protein
MLRAKVKETEEEEPTLESFEQQLNIIISLLHQSWRGLRSNLSNEMASH